MRVSYNQLTELTGKSYRTLKRLLDGLAPVGTGPTNANLWDSQKALEAIYRPVGGCEGDALDLNAERAREAKERADKLELENAKRRGELCWISDVETSWAGIVSRVKVRLTSLPSKISALTDERDERRRLFVEAKAIVNEALDELARGSKD